MYINKVQILGNLTRDPELKAIPSGTKVASFSLATNRSWKDQNGAKQEEVTYHNVVAWAKPAELIAQYCKKGSSLYVEGRLQTRSWDKDGVKQYRTEIVLENFQFGPKSSGSTFDKGEGSPSKDQNKKEDDGLDTIEYPNEDVNPEDIPF